MIYLDSRNIEVLNIDEFNINSFVEDRDKQIRQLTGRPPTAEFYKKYLKHSLYDLRMLLYTLEDVLYKQTYDLRELYNKRVIHNILRNFSSHFDDILSPKPNDNDSSRSAYLKRRFLAITDCSFKQEMKEFLPYVLDCDTDFSPLFAFKKGRK